MIVIRPYEPRDRASVREICCDTADAGNPCGSFFPDREVLADLVTRYYTDFAPQTSWVAEQDGQVVGYLNGCLNTRRSLRTMMWRILPVTLLKAIGRGLFWHPQFCRMFGLNWREWLRREHHVSLEDYPAHLHINLRNPVRGHRVGDELMEKFFAQVRTAGVMGVHACASGANDGGCRFFERLGFIELGRKGRFRHPFSPERLTETIIYGRRIECVVLK